MEPIYINYEKSYSAPFSSYLYSKETVINGCILSKYCGTKAQWKEVDTTFNCPLGVNKNATRLAVSVAAAIAVISQM